MSFITDNFLLQSTYAEELYHSYAKQMPIIDYHNHLDPEQLVNDQQFENISQVWLDGDHYKWRAMRTMGIDEKYITGPATDAEKFQKWAEIVPALVRNPLYHWTQLELQRYFGVNELLSADNAQRIYRKTSLQLQQKSHSALRLLTQMNVEVLCTTDDPVDDLRFHQKAKIEKINPRVLPAFRPDKAYAVEDQDSYRAYLEKLADASKVDIRKYSDLIEALQTRTAYFHENGCRLADHGLEQLYYYEWGAFNIEKVFAKVLSGKPLSQEEIQYFKFETLVHLCREYSAHGWVQQFHLGSLRNTNERMLRQLGPDAGFDSIGDFQQAYPLSQFLNLLDRTDQLTKTILYNLNPNQNEVFASMIGNFNDGRIKGKMQYGAAWWYLDQLDGMEKHINALSNMGVLSCFVGMLTDSRSLLSFSRHEYFRRLLCNIFGNDMEKGWLPPDIAHIGKIVQDICYHNARAYFDFWA